MHDLPMQTGDPNGVRSSDWLDMFRFDEESYSQDIWNYKNYTHDRNLHIRDGSIYNHHDICNWGGKHRIKNHP